MLHNPALPGPLYHALTTHSHHTLYALPKVAKRLPGLAGGALFGALLGYRIG